MKQVCLEKFPTLYSIGDYIHLSGKSFKVLAVHIYLSEKKHTERYYLGDKKWITIHIHF